MATYFCPNCWHQLKEEAQKCPTCGYDLASEAGTSYEDKLLSALRHPIRENRMIAIQLLGRIRSQKALPEFERMLAAEEDYYLLKEVLYALAAINTRPSRRLISEAANHRSRLVRQVAKELSTKQA